MIGYEITAMAPHIRIEVTDIRVHRSQNCAPQIRELSGVI